MKELKVKKILAFFKENEDIFNECIEELDGYNGFLGDDRYYNMEDLDEIFSNTEATEILARAFYGYDAESREDAPFNPNREFFCFNGYGNLVSCDYKDYSNFLDSYTVEALFENMEDIDTITENEELKKMFEDLEK